MEFGRKSEKLDWEIEQLELKLDELEAGRAAKRGALVDHVTWSENLEPSSSVTAKLCLQGTEYGYIKRSSHYLQFVSTLG